MLSDFQSVPLILLKSVVKYIVFLKYFFLSELSVKAVQKVGMSRGRIFSNHRPVPAEGILSTGITKVQPQIVIVVVLGTPEHLELGLKLQN